jgi:DNA-binding CsgD family transcriptional regulator
MTDKENNQINIEAIIKDILDSIDREREKEIISRRFGLFDRRETLEQIGELLGITRERVRQLEKAILTKLRAQAEQGKLAHISEVQAKFIETLDDLGGVARVTNLTAAVVDSPVKTDISKVNFLANLCPELSVLDENDNFYLSVGIKNTNDEKAIKNNVTKIIDAIKKIAKPTGIEEIATEAGIKEPKNAEALASTSKKLATLNGRWGLVKWPLVNPKNIRDKIYVILSEKGEHMHFNEIADAIKESDFKRKDVTTQAIHNELIKDKRFVLIGRGIYALKEWGYNKGTVADVISDVLKKAGKPLHREEIVKEVLKSRYVKETTILLNLQGKSQFKRTAKATYTLAEG